MVPHAYIVESHNRISWLMMLIVDVVDCWVVWVVVDFGGVGLGL